MVSMQLHTLFNNIIIREEMPLLTSTKWRGSFSHNYGLSYQIVENIVFYNKYKLYKPI